MNVTLPPEMERFIDDLVSRGAYPTREDVVRAGIARLRGDDEDVEAETERLRAMIQIGLDDLDAGRSRDGEEVMRELREKYVRLAEEQGEAA